MNFFTTIGREKKNGFCPVYVQLYINRQRVLINTDIEVEKLNFHVKGQIIGKTKEVKDKNLIIESVRNKANEILIKYRLKNKLLTVEGFKDEFKNYSSDKSFNVWMDEEIKKNSFALSNARLIKYRTISNKLKEFNRDIKFNELDYFFIESFKGWLKKKKKNDINTVSSNLAVLKVFCRRAIKKELILKDPFEGIKIIRASGNRVFCSYDELIKLWNLYKFGDFANREYLKITLRHFLFMCVTSLRVSDFSVIKFENIFNNILFFNPIKTRSKKKEVVKIPLNNKALQLIQDEGRKEGLLFDSFRDQTMNKHLKIISQLAGINKNLTNHSARHTFATLFIEKTGDVSTLQKILGHSRINETMVYIHILLVMR